MKDMRYIPQILLRGVQRELYTQLLLKYWVSDLVMRGGITVRILCVILIFKLHCIVQQTWIYQVLDMFSH
jgi:hypothetical protein